MDFWEQLQWHAWVQSPCLAQVPVASCGMMPAFGPPTAAGDIPAFNLTQ